MSERSFRADGPLAAEDDVRHSSCQWVCGEVGYTRTMRTAISIPDELRRHAERVANLLGISRNELITRATREFLERFDRAVTASYDQAFADDEDGNGSLHRPR